MKGIIGAERAKTYTPSAYGAGDRGGSAGGYGLPHGVAGAGGMGDSSAGEVGHMPMVMGFEGGPRGAAVSEQETLPGNYPYPKKKGYDEHRDGFAAEGSIHGLPGVEGISPPGRGGHGMSTPADEDMSDSGGGADGYGCPHGCGANMKSGHGLARHVYTKHGGFGGLARMVKHGSGYNTDKEYRGETEGPAEWSKNEAEWNHAKQVAKSTSSVEGHCSSYESGDKG